jgi:hypothetical protein
MKKKKNIKSKNLPVFYNSQRRLPRIIKKKFIDLDYGVSSGGGRYFKFENKLLKLKGFGEPVKT